MWGHLKLSGVAVPTYIHFCLFGQCQRKQQVVPAMLNLPILSCEFPRNVLSVSDTQCFSLSLLYPMTEPLGLVDFSTFRWYCIFLGQFLFSRANQILYTYYRWWFQISVVIFTPKIGEMIQFDGCMFFKWVGWNHQAGWNKSDFRILTGFLSLRVGKFRDEIWWNPDKNGDCNNSNILKPSKFIKFPPYSFIVDSYGFAFF